MISSVEKLAKILRCDKDFVAKVGVRLGEMTGNKGALEKIIEENDRLVAERLLRLQVTRGASAREVYDALVSKIDADNAKIAQAMRNPACGAYDDCRRVAELTRSVSSAPKRGFFLKETKAMEFLRREPPRKVMAYLKYDSADAMLAKENLFEVYSALRFVEGNEWLNGVFFKQYEALTPDDFEEREIIVRALDVKWVGAAETFLKKKWHNISHLKELGVVFVIPSALGISGELLRMVSLLLHYMHEVPFYSDMFRKIAETPITFPRNLVSLLRGDVEERRLPENSRSFWLVVQRYLAKDDEHDWRLFVPRINPEALHWLRAEEDLVRMGSALDGFAEDLSFWLGTDYAGDFFKDEIGEEVLVSFDLVDTVMSLVKRTELIKYLYHHQEALWNRIFMEYFGREQLEKFSKEYLLQGYFEI